MPQSSLPCMSPWPATPLATNQALRPAPYASLSPVLPPNTALPLSNTPNVKKEVPESLMDLTREDLLKFSSTQYEDFVKDVSLKRSLTTDERREVKRQRRLIKNREYAQTSRNKKKEQVGNMESQLEALAKENTDLKTENASIATRLKEVEEDNKRLNLENLTLKEKLSLLDAGQAAPAPSLASPRPEAAFPAITESASTHSVSSSDEVPSSDESSVDTDAPFLPPPSPPHQAAFNQDFFTEAFLNDDYFSPEPWANPKLTLYVVLFCFAIFLPPVFFAGTPAGVSLPAAPVPGFLPQYVPLASSSSPTSLRLLSLPPDVPGLAEEIQNETSCRVPEAWLIPRRIVTMDDVIFEESTTFSKPISKVTNKSIQVDNPEGRVESYFETYSNPVSTQEPPFFRSLQSTPTN
eukprot:TRINITY_DN11434_c0_g2_i1.p1 TRINITY_DN11434_c0_g2~~TRINITY_DN11434_c0_g2_i1.p1  ORF type:complete len:425 (-),score=66.09 TRINITY_DN11434_c0_g2_i1:57-1280(-)